MAWKDVAAGLGTQALVGEFKAIEPLVSKRQYKRLLSTAVAQLLELDPDTRGKRARRWARKAIGVKPSKKVIKAADQNGAKKLVTEVGPRASRGASRAERAKKAVASTEAGPDSP